MAGVRGGEWSELRPRKQAVRLRKGLTANAKELGLYHVLQYEDWIGGAIALVPTRLWSHGLRAMGGQGRGECVVL